MDYEANIKELENIVNKLNNEKIGLDESIELYNKGIIIAKKSLEELKTFKGKIELLDKELNKLETEVEDD